MTTQRDFDRIAGAWLDLMPSEAPDRAIDSVLRAVARTPQVRRPVLGLPWRSRMNRFTLIAAVAALVVAGLGGAILLTSGAGPSAPTPAPTVAPSPPGSVAPTPEPVVGFDETLWGSWAADADPIAGLPDQGSRIQLTFLWDGGKELVVQTDFVGGYQALKSDSLAADPGQFRIRSQADIDSCQRGDVGTYRWSRSADGLFLSVTLIDDQCDLRAATLARTWVHTHGGVSDGGPGMATSADPYPDILVTLRRGTWGMPAIPPVEISTCCGDTGAARTFVVMYDPIGFVNACQEGVAQKRIDPTAEALATYIGELPGFGDVQSAPVVLDGKPAVHITASSSAGGCATREITILTHQVGVYGNGGMGLITFELGNPLSFWALETGEHLIVLWYTAVPASAPVAEEQAVIDSIRFPDGVPTP